LDCLNGKRIAFELSRNLLAPAPASGCSAGPGGATKVGADIAGAAVAPVAPPHRGEGAGWAGGATPVVALAAAAPRRQPIIIIIN
jgi:hypothetical protein